IDHKPCYGIIESNFCINAYKRGIKVQSAETKVLNNYIYRDLPVSYSGISVYGNDCIIQGNTITTPNSMFSPGIDTEGSNLIISKNEIKNAISNLNDGIYYSKDRSTNKMESITITDNQIYNVRYSVRQSD